MDWSKLNMDEIYYYCKDTSSLSFFDCSPFGLQMEDIIMIFYYYGIEKFSVKDIQEFYNIMQIPKMKSEGIIKPIPSKIQKIASRMKNIKRIDDNTFQIVSGNFGLYFEFDTSLYAAEIKRGYQENKIKVTLSGQV